MRRITFLLLVTAVILSGCTSAEKKAVQELADTMVASSLDAEQSFINVGVISMDQGDESVFFTLTNTGSEPVVIKEVYTSCGCTKARILNGEDTSAFIAMKHANTKTDVLEKVDPGSSVQVEAVYDPLFHGPDDTGVKRRSIFLETNSRTQPQVRLDFQLDVVKTAAELPPVSMFDFSDTEHDFGIVTQSGGIVSHSFPFTYNGNEPIEVTSVPTSCGCTTASIDKKTLTKGDKAIITVEFDPNLHEEPEGRFFKTINLVTEPEIEDIPELKIWAEIDLDLGPEAYKLQTHND